MDKELATKNLKLLKKVFDKFGVRFFLAYGTCLGAYRDNNFLPGDNDIDIMVTDNVDFKTRKDIVLRAGPSLKTVTSLLLTCQESC